MSKSEGIYFSVSGIGTARAADLFHSLKTNLQDYLPDRNVTFLGTPFKGFLHPLRWDQAEQKLDATSRLFGCWALLNEHVVKQLRPALDRGDVVVTYRFGLDVLLYATAIERCVDENDEAKRLHRSFVRARIIEQNIKPPMYLIPNMVDLDKIASDWLPHSPALKDVGCDDLRRFVEYEKRVMNDYFNPDHGQNLPFYINASLTSKQMCQLACDHIRATLAGVQAVAA